MKELLLSLLANKVIIPALHGGAVWALNKASKMKNGLGKEVITKILTPIVESENNPIDGQDILPLVQKLKVL